MCEGLTVNQSDRVSGIYAIRHLSSGKMYIGSAVNIVWRWQLHRNSLNRGDHHSRYLQRAWDKYGSDAFVWEILEVVFRPVNLIYVEQEYLNRYKPWKREWGYNISPTAGSSLGVKRSDEFRAKVSAGQQGRKQSPETRAKISVGVKNRSPEIVARIAAANRGKKQPPEAIAKTAAAHRGKEKSPEHRAKISATLQGRNKGQPKSEETRARMSAAQQLRSTDISAAHRKREYSSKYRFRCVYPSGSGFFARIHCNGRNTNLPVVRIEIEAALMCNYAAHLLYGDFAHLNEIPENEMPTTERQWELYDMVTKKLTEKGLLAA